MNDKRDVNANRSSVHYLHLRIMDGFYSLVQVKVGEIVNDYQMFKLHHKLSFSQC